MYAGPPKIAQELFFWSYHLRVSPSNWRKYFVVDNLKLWLNSKTYSATIQNSYGNKNYLNWEMWRLAKKRVCRFLLETRKLENWEIGNIEYFQIFVTVVGNGKSGNWLYRAFFLWTCRNSDILRLAICTLTSFCTRTRPVTRKCIFKKKNLCSLSFFKVFF